MEAPEENAAASAVDAVTQMTNRFSAINTDDADAGPLKLDDVDGNVYSCKHCRTHLAVADDIISKSFHCKNGKAYLFDKVINVAVGEKEDRMMITGMHSISDIFCVGCGEIVGWKYGAAYERSQKYKENLFSIGISCLDLNEDMTRWQWHTVFSVELWLEGTLVMHTVYNFLIVCIYEWINTIRQAQTCLWTL